MFRPSNVAHRTSSRPQRIADASGSTRFIDFFYGADGRISAVQDHTGRTVQYLYDSLGYLTTVTDPMARNTRYEYVASRFRKKMSRIADHWNREITAMTYASTGRLNSYTEQGMLYTFTYPWESFKRDALGNEWRYLLGAGGVVTRRIFPDGGQLRNDIDADGRTIFVIDEVGARTRTSYFSDGRVAVIERGTEANPRIQNVYYSYDATFPDKVAAIRPMNFDATAPDRSWQEWKYDYYPPGSPAPGALHHVYRVLTDGTQQTMTTYVYDTRGRVTSAADAAGSMTDYVYDAAGNLQSVTPPSNNDAGTRPTTTYAYDVLGRVTSVTDPLGKATPLRLSISFSAIACTDNSGLGRYR